MKPSLGVALGPTSISGPLFCDPTQPSQVQWNNITHSIDPAGDIAKLCAQHNSPNGPMFGTRLVHAQSFDVKLTTSTDIEFANGCFNTLAIGHGRKTSRGCYAIERYFNAKGRLGCPEDRTAIYLDDGTLGDAFSIPTLTSRDSFLDQYEPLYRILISAFQMVSPGPSAHYPIQMLRLHFGKTFFSQRIPAKDLIDLRTPRILDSMIGASAVIFHFQFTNKREAYFKIDKMGTQFLTSSAARKTSTQIIPFEVPAHHDQPLYDTFYLEGKRAFLDPSPFFIRYMNSKAHLHSFNLTPLFDSQRGLYLMSQPRAKLNHPRAPWLARTYNIVHTVIEP